MSEDIIKELNLEQLRARLLKYTREAFHMLPKMDKPGILDIGCGTGIPTIELAKLSNGEIYGIDIDQKALDKLNFKIEQRGLSNRVRTRNCSIHNTGFPDEKFTLLWDEGAIHILDLKKSLKECNRLLKPDGFLVSGESIKWFKDNFEIFAKYGFKLISQLLLPEGCWWTEYYSPLEQKINFLRKKYENLDNIEEIKKHLREIEMVKKNISGFDCITYIMQKIN